MTKDELYDIHLALSKIHNGLISVADAVVQLTSFTIELATKLNAYPDELKNLSNPINGLYVDLKDIGEFLAKIIPSNEK